MHINFLFRRLLERFSKIGVLETVKNLLYFNKEVMIIEKDIRSYDLEIKDRDIQYKVVTERESKEIGEKYGLPLIHYLSINQCTTLIAINDTQCVGFIRWTQDKHYKDVKRFGIQLEPNEVYMFDFYVFPNFRGDSAITDIPTAAIHHLKSQGITKFYGSYFLENLPALWWHRAILKATDLHKIKIKRFLSVDFYDGRPFFPLLNR